MIRTLKAQIVPAVIFAPLFIFDLIPFSWLTSMAVATVVVVLIYSYLDANFILSLEQLGNDEGQRLVERMLKDQELTSRRYDVWCALIMAACTLWFPVMDPVTFYAAMCAVWFTLRHWWLVVNDYLADYDSIDDLINR